MIQEARRRKKERERFVSSVFRQALKQAPEQPNQTQHMLMFLLYLINDGPKLVWSTISAKQLADYTTYGEKT